MAHVRRFPHVVSRLSVGGLFQYPQTAHVSLLHIHMMLACSRGSPSFASHSLAQPVVAPPLERWM